MALIPLIIASRQTAKGSRSGDVPISACGGGSEAVVLGAHLAVVQTGDKEAGPTIEGEPGLDRDRKGRFLTV